MFDVFTRPHETIKSKKAGVLCAFSLMYSKCLKWGEALRGLLLCDDG